MKIMALLLLFLSLCAYDSDITAMSPFRRNDRLEIVPDVSRGWDFIGPELRKVLR